MTWADTDGNTPLDPAWQSYFMLTQEEILLDHQMDDGTVATGKNQPQTQRRNACKIGSDSKKAKGPCNSRVLY